MVLPLAVEGIYRVTNNFANKQDGLSRGLLTRWGIVADFFLKEKLSSPDDSFSV
jgi:hypothetical protein